MNDIKKMMVINGVNLDKQVIAASGVMSLNDFRNLLQCLYNIVEIFRVLEIKTHVGTCFIAYLLRVNNKL